MHRIDTLAKAGVSRRHDMVIKGLCFLGEDKVVSGTPECSYYIQKTESQRSYAFLIISLLCMILLLVRIEGEL
jgi:hypothetical protein